jgi:hypothetical protein
VPDIDDFLRRQEQIIDTVGWTVMHVPTDADPDPTALFAYTVGLTPHDNPELLIAWLPPQAAHALLNDLAGRVYDKAERFTHGQRISDLISPATTRSSSKAHRPTTWCRGSRSPATAATRCACSRWCGPTSRAGSRGTKDTTSIRRCSR